MIKKIILLLLSIATISICLKLFILPAPPYEYGQWGMPYNQEEHRFSFCTYNLPVGFDFFSYSSDVRYQKEMLIFKNSKEGSYLLLFKLREFPVVDTSKVLTSAGKVSKSYDTETTSFRNNMDFVYMLPIAFVNREVDVNNKELQIKGLSVSAKSLMEQPVNKILYLKGEFEKIAFIKQSKNIHAFPTPVLDFKTRKQGYLGILEAKQQQECFFVMYYADSFSNLREDDFKSFLKSITFEKKAPYLKQLYEDALKSGSLRKISR